jgi:hypothetical protein
LACTSRAAYSAEVAAKVSQCVSQCLRYSKCNK